MNRFVFISDVTPLVGRLPSQFGKAGFPPGLKMTNSTATATTRNELAGRTNLRFEPFQPVHCKPCLYYEPRRRLEAPPGVSHDCPMSLPCVSPVNFIGFAYRTEVPAACPNTGHCSPCTTQDAVFHATITRSSCPGAPARIRYFETMPCGPMEKKTITSWSITNKTRSDLSPKGRRPDGRAR